MCNVTLSLLQISDAMDEAKKYILEEKDPPWIVEKFVSHEIGRLILNQPHCILSCTVPVTRPHPIPEIFCTRPHPIPSVYTHVITYTLVPIYNIYT